MKIYNVKGNSDYSINVAAESSEEAIKTVLLRDTEGQFGGLEKISDTEFLFRCGNFKTIMSASEIPFGLNKKRRTLYSTEFQYSYTELFIRQKNSYSL